MVGDKVYEGFMDCSEALGHNPVQQTKEEKYNNKVSDLLDGLKGLVGAEPFVENDEQMQLDLKDFDKEDAEGWGDGQ